MAQSNRSAASYVAESRNTKPLSNAMFNWAKANMSKLKSPTAAQKKIFAKYKAMVKAGNTPANPKPKPAASKPTQSKPAQSKATPKSANRGAAFLDMGGQNVKEVKKTGTHGQYRKKGDPGPAVRRRGSVGEGESLDPRERQLRRNQARARRDSHRNLRINRRGRRI